MLRAIEDYIVEYTNRIINNRIYLSSKYKVVVLCYYQFLFSKKYYDFSHLINIKKDQLPDQTTSEPWPIPKPKIIFDIRLI